MTTEPHPPDFGLFQCTRKTKNKTKFRCRIYSNLFPLHSINYLFTNVRMFDKTPLCGRQRYASFVVFGLFICFFALVAQTLFVGTPKRRKCRKIKGTTFNLSVPFFVVHAYVGCVWKRNQEFFDARKRRPRGYFVYIQRLGISLN